MSIDIIRIPDAEDSSYDRLFAVPEGKTPEEAVAAFNARLVELDEDESGEDRTGDALAAILIDLGLRPIMIHNTMEEW